MTSEKPAYDKLVALIKERHDHAISERDAHRMARNLMGYCELVMRVAAKIPEEQLDKQHECGSVSIGMEAHL